MRRYHAMSARRLDEPSPTSLAEANRVNDCLMSAYKT